MRKPLFNMQGNVTFLQAISVRPERNLSDFLCNFGNLILEKI
jgi:hypothetical protein